MRLVIALFRLNECSKGPYFQVAAQLLRKMPIDGNRCATVRELFLFHFILKSLLVTSQSQTVQNNITKTCLYNFDPF